MTRLRGNEWRLTTVVQENVLHAPERYAENGGKGKFYSMHILPQLKSVNFFLKKKKCVSWSLVLGSGNGMWGLTWSLFVAQGPCVQAHAPARQSWVWVLAPVWGCATLNTVLTCLSTRFLMREIDLDSTWGDLRQAHIGVRPLGAVSAGWCLACLAPDFGVTFFFMSRAPYGHVSGTSSVLPGLCFISHRSARRTKLTCSL